MAKDPAALQLRLLQTVVEVAGEKNSTLVMPVPVELLRFFEKMAPGPAAPTGSTALAEAEAQDLGDAEVAAAEAAISHTAAPPTAAIPAISDTEVPPVPAVPGWRRPSWRCRSPRPPRKSPYRPGYRPLGFAA